MIGVFDSGVGGICAFRRVRELMPREDMIYLADRKNAPYGTKSEDEIRALTERNIKLLRGLGAEVVLIACCTASSLHHTLCREAREISIPIIAPAAALAAKVGKKIAVIATNHTATSGAFSREIGRLSDAIVFEMSEQPLVALVEKGSRDGRVTEECREYLRGLRDRISATGADTLILGCTHFSHLEKEIGGLLPRVKIISPARVGAEETVRKINAHRESGRVTYISPAVK